MPGKETAGKAGNKRKRADVETAEDGDDLRAEAPTAAAGASAGTIAYTNKQRCLVFGTRGMTARYRHLMEDLRAMIPHHKKEAKLDAKEYLAAVNEIAESKSCNTTVFFEVRKKRDLFLWMSCTPNGPSVKFHVVNVHTMDELRLTGNCLKGSRPILSFDSGFDDEEKAPHLCVIKELLSQVFATPRGHPKSQPFHDHVLNFGLADGRVWVRHYQILDKTADAKEAAKALAAGEKPMELVEIGPRFVLEVVRVFAGSMHGAALYSNPDYVSPNALRLQLARAKAGKYVARTQATLDRELRAKDLVAPKDPLADVFA